MSVDWDVCADESIDCETASASCSPKARVSVLYPSGTSVPFGLKIVRHPAGCPAEKNCSGVPEMGSEKTCGDSTLPTDPAISIATPPYRCSSDCRKKCGQSELTATFSP